MNRRNFLTAMTEAPVMGMVGTKVRYFKLEDVELLINGVRCKGYIEEKIEEIGFDSVGLVIRSAEIPEATYFISKDYTVSMKIKSTNINWNKINELFFDNIRAGV